MNYEHNQPPMITKNPGIAAVLSFFYAGLGQIYNGQIAKGIAFMVIQAINLLLMLVIIGFFTYFAFWVFGMYDAYQTAIKINSRMSGQVGVTG